MHALLVDYRRALRLFNRDVRLFLVSSALMGICWKGIYAVLFNLYLLRLGYGARQIGIANAAPTFVYGLSCLPAGLLGSRWGSRRAMIVGAAVVALGLALPPCAEWVPAAYQFGWLLASYSVAWMGAALVIVNGSPFLMDSTGPAERDHAFSIQVGLWPLAGFLGSMVGGVLPAFFANAFGLTPDSAAAYRYALFVAAALYVPACPILAATGRQPPTEAERALHSNSPVPWVHLLLTALVTLLYVGGDGVFRSFYNVYLDAELGLSTPVIGAISAAGMVAATALALAAPPLMARWGRKRSFVAVTLCMALGLIPLALVRHWAVAATSVIVMSSLPYLARPILTVYQMHLVTRRWQEAMSAVGTLGRAFGWSAASVAGGYLVATAGYSQAFLAGAAVTALGSGVFWALSRERGLLT
jgi:MFS family permease